MSYESRMARIEGLADFKGDPEYGLDPTGSRAADRAKVVWELMQEEPGVFTTGDGSINFEWVKDGKMVVIEIFGEDDERGMHGDVWVSEG